MRITKQATTRLIDGGGERPRLAQPCDKGDDADRDRDPYDAVKERALVFEARETERSKPVPRRPAEEDAAAADAAQRPDIADAPGDRPHHGGGERGVDTARAKKRRAVEDEGARKRERSVRDEARP